MLRLQNPQVLSDLVQFLSQHLGPQYADRLNKPAREFSEEEKLQFVPLLFGLMPRAAAIRSSPYLEVKPLIREHLQTISIVPDDLLLDLLKELCDNFDRTQPSSPQRQTYRPRKPGLADLRQRTGLYRAILQRQNQRCAVCGTRFAGDVQETLDHIIPWRLGGDPEGGVNWQILCKACNDAKSDLLSSLCMVEYFNWVYSDRKDIAPDLSDNRISLRTRYLLLSHARRCQQPDCQLGPKEAQLSVMRRTNTGFSVFDHLTVRCEYHKQQEGLVEVCC